MKGNPDNSGVKSTPKVHKRKRRQRRESLSDRGFTLFRRAESGTWYFYMVRNGKRVARSTHTADYEKARAAAREYLNPAHRGIVTLEEFAKNFFTWGKCSWIAAQHAAGRPFSQGAALGRRGHLDTWILPAFGKRPLSSITAADVRNFLVGLPLSGQSKNHVKYTMKIIFSEAVFAELLDRNPAELVKNFALNVKIRDPFSLDDLRLLFPRDEAKLLTIWGDLEISTAFLVLASTGIRAGELRALAWRHVGTEAVELPMGQAEISYLTIEQAVKFATGGAIGTTKAGKARPVFLPPRARDALEAWRFSCPWAEPVDLVFPGKERGHPLKEAILGYRLERAMVRARVERDGRNLVVHSFRHGYVTRNKRALPAAVLMLMAGHADEKTSQGYFHPTMLDQIKEIGAAKGAIEAASDW